MIFDALSNAACHFFLCGQGVALDGVFITPQSAWKIRSASEVRVNIKNGKLWKIEAYFSCHDYPKSIPALPLVIAIFVACPINRDKMVSVTSQYCNTNNSKRCILYR